MVPSRRQMTPDPAGLPSEGVLHPGGPRESTGRGPTRRHGHFRDSGESQAGSQHHAAGAERAGGRAPLSGTHFQHQLPTLTLLGSWGHVLRPVTGSLALPCGGPGRGDRVWPTASRMPARWLHFGFGSQDGMQPSVLLDTPGLTRCCLLPRWPPKSVSAGMPAPPGMLVFRREATLERLVRLQGSRLTWPLSDPRLGNTQVP